MFDQGLLPGFESPPQSTHGLFFAALPDEAAACRMAEVTRGLREVHGVRTKPQDPERLHVTLYFLGDHFGLPDRLIAKAEEAAATVAMPTFAVRFDRVASFSAPAPRKAPLVLLTDGGGSALKRFQQSLATTLKRAGLPPVVNDRFTPHVTLLYDHHRVAEHEIEPIEWTVREFVLIASLLGEARHLHLARWSLRD